MNGNMQNRRNWTRSLSVVITVAVIGAVIGCLADDGIVTTDRIYLQNSAGAVLFDHQAHKESVDTCVQCHHNLNEQGGDDLDELQAASCRECHPTTQQSEKQTQSCTVCHEDDYEPDMMEHDEYLEISDHSCLGCHSPKSVSEVYHINCSNCHLETLPDRFTTAGGDVSCGACHLR
jgi:hypothetical protein